MQIKPFIHGLCSELRRASRKRLVSVVMGLASLAAVGLGTMPANSQVPAGAPDPTMLPVATTTQVPLTTAYDALGVPSMTAGSWYLDPTTNVKIYKLTSATFPASSPNWTHDYAEGGNEVSLPYTADGVTRAVLVRKGASGPYWLIDFTPSVGVSNPRALTGNFAPNIELAFTFSSNPATPYYAYVGGANGIRRFDLRTLTEAPGNGWPLLSETNAVWLHQSENDSFFVWMRGTTGPTSVGYEPCTGTPCTGTLKTHTDANVNEPRIDRAGRYVGLSMDVPDNGLNVWDWQTDTITWTTGGDPGIPFAHGASLRSRWIVSNFNTNTTFGMFTPSVPGSGTDLPGPITGTTAYVNGNWIQYPADLDDQWALTYYYGGLVPLPEDAPIGFDWLAPGGMVFMTANGERRLLGHSYNTSGTYGFYTYGKSSSDGYYVLFNSDMNGSGRSDVFLAELPRPAAAGAEVGFRIRTPHDGATVKGVIGVLATALCEHDDRDRRDDGHHGVIGVPATALCERIATVEFMVDGQPAGVQHRRPYWVWVDTRTLSNGHHTITAVALDAAHSRIASDSVTVLVSNPTPEVRIKAPHEGARVNGETSVLAWVTHHGNVASLQFQLDGVNLGRAITRHPYGVRWNTLTIPNGRHTLTAVVTTRAGARIVSDPVTVMVANPVPTVKIETPKAGATVKGRVTVEADVTQSRNVRSLQFQLDGVNLGPAITRPDYSFRWDTAAAAVGQHRLTAVITTMAGDEITSAAVVVTVKR